MDSENMPHDTVCDNGLTRFELINSHPYLQYFRPKLRDCQDKLEAANQKVALMEKEKREAAKKEEEFHSKMKAVVSEGRSNETILKMQEEFHSKMLKALAAKARSDETIVKLKKELEKKSIKASELVNANKNLDMVKGVCDRQRERLSEKIKEVEKVVSEKEELSKLLDESRAREGEVEVEKEELVNEIEALKKMMDGARETREMKDESIGKLMEKMEVENKGLMGKVEELSILLEEALGREIDMIEEEYEKVADYEGIEAWECCNVGETESCT